MLVLLGIACAALAGCHSFKPLPDGLAVAGPDRPAARVEFLADRTWVEPDGQRRVEQEIFDRLFELIDGARSLIVADLFLYNDWQGPVPETTRALSSELTERLLEKKASTPGIRIVMITDPVNTLYGGLASAQFDALSAAGVSVVQTNLDPLRDSNVLYSPLWRLFVKPLGNDPGGILPNPIGPGDVSLRTYLKLFNFKANHRKTLIADNDGELVAMVMSANPHDGSSAHRNAAVLFDGMAVLDLLASENAVLAMSGAPLVDASPWRQEGDDDAAMTVRVVTEREILNAIVAELATVGDGDHVDLMMFYLSSRDVIDALLGAQRSGARVRVLLDPNKDAFGRQKSGVPNRPVARELDGAGIPVRWCDTHGEQCHAKTLMVQRADGRATLITGSANLTRRNLNNLNLETDVVVNAPSKSAFMRAALLYFDQAWLNLDRRQASVEYDLYRDDSIWSRIRYWFMEFSGFSSF